MAYTAPVVCYNSGASATWYTLTGVQSVNISRGRQRFQDPVNQSSLQVELIPATFYTLELGVGQTIEVRTSNDGNADCYFQGRITDIQRSYAFPYNSGTNYAPGDRIIISATGATGIIGTAQLSSYALASDYVNINMGLIAVGQQVVSQQLDTGSTVLNSGNTVTGAALDAMNQLARTAQITFDDFAAFRANPMQYGIVVYNTGTVFQNISFTDTGSGYAYVGLEFLSSVQNTFNWVSVQPTGLAPAITSGTSPYNALNYATYSASTPDATNLSGYLYNMLSGQQAAVPYSISTNTMASAACMDLARITKYGMPTDKTQTVMGQPVAVTFRGSTTNGSVIGVNSAFYTDHAAVQLYLSPSLGTPFTLDSSAFGVLDTNRLGYP